MSTSSLSTYDRFRRVLIHAEENGDDISPRLETRLNHLLDDTDTDDLEERVRHTRAYLRIMPRIRRELCELLVEDIVLQLVEYDDLDVPELEIYFDPELYISLGSCVDNGLDGTYDWDIDQKGQYSGLLVQIDWRTVIQEGGGSAELIGILEEYGFHLDRTFDASDEPQAHTPSGPFALTEDEKSCRPVGSEIEPKIQKFLMEKHDGSKSLSQHRFEIEVCKAMLANDVDAAFIYAFQKLGVFVTQENSKDMTPSVLSRWDEFVKDYRSLHKKD